MTSIFELVHGTETVLTNRYKKLQERLDECCPKEEEKPEFCYEPCKEVKYEPYKRKDISWKPLKKAKDIE